MSTEQARLQDHVDSIARDLDMPWEEWDQDLAEDPDQGFTAWDYMQDVLDFTYELDSDRRVIGGSLLLSFGGPNIQLDLRSGRVHGHWGGNYAEAMVTNREQLDELIDHMSDLFYC